MCTSRRRELIFQNAHRAQARALFCRPKMVLMTSQVRKMSTALRREHHSQQKCAPRAGESAAARPRRAGRGCRQQKFIDLFTRDVRETHRASTGEPWGGPSLVNSTRIARPCRKAGRATAHRQMAATRSLAQQNEFNLHLDSAGHRFGATAHGGSRRHIWRAGKKCEIVARKSG